MNNWKEVKSNNELQHILTKFNDFHDGCIKEIRYISGSYVAEDMSMYPIDSIKEVCVIIQRQFKNPSVIEFKFCGVERLNLTPSDDNCDSIIFSVLLEMRDGYIYFADNNYEIDDLDKSSNHCTWIKSKELKWRIADEYIGSEQVYINK